MTVWFYTRSGISEEVKKSRCCAYGARGQVTCPRIPFLTTGPGMLLLLLRELVEEKLGLCGEGMSAVKIVGGKGGASLLDVFLDLGRGFLFLIIEPAIESGQAVLCVVERGDGLSTQIGGFAGG